MDWLRVVDSAGRLQFFFGESEQHSSVVSVQEIVAHRDGREVRIRLDLEEYPESPPAKWVKAGNNVVQLVVSMIEVESLELNGLARTMNLSVVAERDADVGLVRLTMSSDAVRFEATARFVHVASVSGYRNEERIRQ